MVKVSIGVPVYNANEYLRECLDSILNQTFQDFEVLLVDDGSTDGSYNICYEYDQKVTKSDIIIKTIRALMIQEI